MSVPELDSSFSEDDPTLTADQLEIYFDSDRPGTGNEDIYRSVRASVDDPWGPPELVVELSSASADLSPGISRDGLTIYWATQGGSGTGLDIHMATRPDRQSAWSTPTRVVELAAVGEDSNPQPSADELELWMCSKRGGVAERQLYLATRPDRTAAWSPPVAIDALNVDANTYTGDVSPNTDGTIVYFASGRPGGQGLTDIWRVERLTATTFGVPENVIELDDAAAQHDPWVSPDEHTIYLSTHVNGSSTIVVSTR